MNPRPGEVWLADLAPRRFTLKAKKCRSSPFKRYARPFSQSRPRISARPTMSRGCSLMPGQPAQTSTPRRSMARCSAATRGGSTRPATGRLSVSGTGGKGWIGRTADDSRSTCGRTHPSTTRDDLCDVPGLKMPDGSPARLYSGFRKGPILAAFQMDAAVRNRRRLSQPVRRARRPAPARRGTSTWCSPTCARDVIARGGSGR